MYCVETPVTLPDPPAARTDMMHAKWRGSCWGSCDVCEAHVTYVGLKPYALTAFKTPRVPPDLRYVRNKKVGDPREIDSAPRMTPDTTTECTSERSVSRSPPQPPGSSRKSKTIENASRDRTALIEPFEAFCAPRALRGRCGHGSHSRWFWTFATIPVAEADSERRSARSYTRLS